MGCTENAQVIQSLQTLLKEQLKSQEVPTADLPHMVEAIISEANLYRSLREEKARIASIHWVERIPKQLRELLIAYRDDGQNPGDFLYAFLSNDLFMALAHADAHSLEALPRLMFWCRRFMPFQARSSEENVKKWIKMNGMRGLNQDIAKTIRARWENERAEIKRDET